MKSGETLNKVQFYCIKIKNIICIYLDAFTIKKTQIIKRTDNSPIKLV